MLEGQNQLILKKIVGAAYERALSQLDSDSPMVTNGQEIFTEFISLWAAERPQLVFGLDDVADALKKMILTYLNITAIVGSVDITDFTPLDFAETAKEIMQTDDQELRDTMTDIASQIPDASRSSYS